jgi:DNA primase
MIPERIVEEVRARADIVEIIGEQVPLKRAGKDFKALCPFHHEKTPSFHVVPSKGFYNCFGCGASGDVFRFVMARTGASFPDAVRQIAAKVGVEIPADAEGGTAEEPHRALYEAMAFASDHFQRQLQSPSGQIARRYLEHRGIAAASVERFLLGHSSGEWRELREAAHRHGIEDAVLLGAGLIKESEKSDEPYDRFRDRVIFPIAEVSGRLVAFGGRALRQGENTPKYLNSPETPIYHKGLILYGLNWARQAIRREGAALVVEGYMDYVSLASRGIEHVVAGMGTALTGEQANLIARYTAKTLLLYDSDTAGTRATFRSADALLRAGVHPLVVTLPPGEDPDSLVRSGGAQALQPHLENAVDVIERKLEILQARGFFADIDGQRRALDRLLPTIRATLDPALRDIYIQRVAERTGVRPDTLEHEVEHGGDGGSLARWRTPRAQPERRRSAAVAATSTTGPASERLLLFLMLRDPARIPQAQRVVSPEDLADPAHRELYEALLRHGGVNGGADALGLSAVARLRFDEIQRDRTEISDGDRSFEDAVADIKEIRGLFRRLDELDAKVARARDAQEQITIVQQKTEVWRELRARGVGELNPRYSSRRFRRRSRDPRESGPDETPTEES